MVSLFWLQRLSSFHLNLAPCGHCRLWKCSPVSTSWRVEPGKGRMAYHFLKGRFCSIMRAGPMEVGRVRRILQFIKPVEMKVWNWGWRGGNKELEGDPWDLEWGVGGEEAGWVRPMWMEEGTEKEMRRKWLRGERERSQKDHLCFRQNRKVNVEWGESYIFSYLWFEFYDFRCYYWLFNKKKKLIQSSQY